MRNIDRVFTIIFTGSGLKAQSVYRRVQTVDLAITLSAWLGIKPPSGASGRVLGEVVEQR